MPFNDWLQKYPGVAKLLQQPDDVLEYSDSDAPLSTQAQQHSRVRAIVEQLVETIPFLLHVEVQTPFAETLYLRLECEEGIEECVTINIASWQYPENMRLHGEALRYSIQRHVIEKRAAAWLATKRHNHYTALLFNGDFTAVRAMLLERGQPLRFIHDYDHISASVGVSGMAETRIIVTYHLTRYDPITRVGWYERG